MKKILFVSPYFHPELISSGKYNTALVESLKEGNEVDVWCMHPFYPEWIIQPFRGAEDTDWVKRSGSWVKFPRKAIFRRFVLEFVFMLIVLRNIIFSRKKYDTVVSVLPPSLFALLLVFLFRKSTNIGIVHDLQSVYIAQKKGAIASIAKTLIHFVENHCFKRFDKILFLSVSMRNNALETYDITSEKCDVQYPFITLDRAETGNTLEGVLPEDKINVVYSGALGEKQNPDALFGFFSDCLKEHADIRIAVFSKGPFFDELKRRYDGLCEGRLVLNNLVPKESLGELYLRSDLQIIPQMEGSSDGSLPSKLPNVLSSGVPVFVVTDSGSELERLIQESGAGIVSDSWDSGQLRSQFAVCLDTLRSRNFDSERIRRFAQDNFNVHNVVESICE